LTDHKDLLPISTPATAHPIQSFSMLGYLSPVAATPANISQENNRGRCSTTASSDAAVGNWHSSIRYSTAGHLCLITACASRRLDRHGARSTHPGALAVATAVVPAWPRAHKWCGAGGRRAVRARLSCAAPAAQRRATCPRFSNLSPRLRSRRVRPRFSLWAPAASSPCCRHVRGRR
jgi:hypothetical protein